MKNVLVTGATGFVGTALCKRLVKAGHQVTVLSRQPDKATQVLPKGIQVHLWESHNAVPPKEAFTDIDAVIHLSGESVVGRWTKSKKEAIYDTRVTGTRNLVRAINASDHRPELFLSASAIGFYGDRADEELTESSEGGRDFLADVCDGWESAANRAENEDTRVVKLRIGVVLGPGGGAIAAMKKFFTFFIGGPLGNGKQWWSWIHRDDLVGLILHCIDKPVRGIVNATAPNPVRQKDFAKELGKVMRKPSFMPAPSFAIKAALGGFSTELLSSKKVLPLEAVKAGYKFQFAEVGPALVEVMSND